ncbi:MAG: helix-turn-helix domain-containing protein [Clostridia bacterium]|nr:helix-turn-helix domain-containing protein [Clostridia bacterium]
MKIFDTKNKAELIKKFPYHNDTDIYIHNIGYNNFDYIKPIKWIHRQLGYTLHYVFEGSGNLYLNGKEFHITEKQIFFLPPSEDLMYYPDEDNRWKYVWFYFSGNQAKQLGESMGFSLDNPIRNVKEYKKLESDLLDMMMDAERGNINEYKARSAFYTIVGEFCENESNDQLTKNCADEAARFLDTNFARSDFSVETLCSLLYISHSALCKAFKEEYDITPLRYLIQIRMQHAAKLLAESNISVREISELSGYKDEIHFMKTFKKYYGLTATEYRQKMHRKNRKSDKA